MLKFEIGKKYNRYDKDLGPIEIIYMAKKGNYPVIGVDSEYRTVIYTLKGKYYADGTEDCNDLVSEYQEPAPLLTPNDVGRKVELEDGSIYVITGYSPHRNSFQVNGNSYNSQGLPRLAVCHKIVKFLD